MTSNESVITKRSKSVTAAGIALIIVGVFLFLGMLAKLLLPTNVPTGSPNAILRLLIIVLIFWGLAIWEIVTGIGVLRLRRWAWFCVLAIGVQYFAEGSYRIWRPPHMVQSPSLYPAWLIALQYIAIVFSTIVPLALGIWWIVLFTRPSVEAQFAKVPPRSEQQVASEDGSPS